MAVMPDSKSLLHIEKHNRQFRKNWTLLKIKVEKNNRIMLFF